jgi:hypothetical protein
MLEQGRLARYGMVLLGLSFAMSADRPETNLSADRIKSTANGISEVVNNRRLTRNEQIAELRELHQQLGKQIDQFSDGASEER